MVASTPEISGRPDLLVLGLWGFTSLQPWSKATPSLLAPCTTSQMGHFVRSWALEVRTFRRCSCETARTRCYRLCKVVGLTALGLPSNDHVAASGAVHLSCKACLHLVRQQGRLVCEAGTADGDVPVFRARALPPWLDWRKQILCSKSGEVVGQTAVSRLQSSPSAKNHAYLIEEMLPVLDDIVCSVQCKPVSRVALQAGNCSG